MIDIQLEGFSPSTEHGIHIHEYGDIITQGKWLLFPPYSIFTNKD